jgi:hypothetical protein
MNIVSTINGLENLVTLKGASKDEIKKAENSLELSFAEDYKTYLEKYALISARHIEITGLVESKRLNVVDVTLAERPRRPLPPDMYVIDNTGIEGILVLQNRDGEIFESQDSGTIKKIYSSLSEYIRSK